MDLVAGVEGVEVLGLVEIPEHGGSILSTGSTERAVGGDGDGVDVTGVTDVVGLDAAGSEFPDLEEGYMLACRTLRRIGVDSGYKNEREEVYHQCVGDWLSHRLDGSLK